MVLSLPEHLYRQEQNISLKKTMQILQQVDTIIESWYSFHPLTLYAQRNVFFLYLTSVSTNT